MEYLNEMKNEINEKMKGIKTIQDILNISYILGYADKSSMILFTKKEITHNQYADFVTFILDIRIELEKKMCDIIYKR